MGTVKKRRCAKEAGSNKLVYLVDSMYVCTGTCLIGPRTLYSQTFRPLTNWTPDVLRQSIGKCNVYPDPT